MIRRLVVACALLAAVAPANARDLVGAWTATVPEQHPDQLEFSMQFGSSEHSGSRFERSAFTGLTAAQIASPARVPVQFEMRRDAGTLDFDGTFRAGRGGGDFTFLPNHQFVATLHSLGVEFHPRHGDEDQELFSLTVFDVSAAFIRSMQKIGYDESIEMYEQFRIFGVDPDYVREMAGVGFSRLPAEKLVETRIHGATPGYIREMRAGGNDLTLDGYVQSRIFQITPEFTAAMEHAGYAHLDHDMLTQFRIHGVTAEFVQQLGALGYTRLPAERLVEMRIHGVTPEFIRRVEAAGYHKVPVEKLVQMRIFGIDPEMVRALDDGAKPD